MISEALYLYKQNIIVGTKGGMVRFGMQDALAGSLRRLKLERIDLYQLDRNDPNVPAEIIFEFLAKAQQSGKIRHLGLSEVSVENIKLGHQYFKVVSVQYRYCVLDREWESVLVYCKAERIAFIPWFPIGGGMTPMKEQLQRIANHKGITMYQLALSWLLNRSDNILLIPDTSSISHLGENVQASKISLSDDDLEELNASAGK